MRQGREKRSRGKYGMNCRNTFGFFTAFGGRLEANCTICVSKCRDAFSVPERSIFILDNAAVNCSCHIARYPASK